MSVRKVRIIPGCDVSAWFPDRGKETYGGQQTAAEVSAPSATPARYTGSVCEKVAACVHPAGHIAGLSSRHQRSCPHYDAPLVEKEKTRTIMVREGGGRGGCLKACKGGGRDEQ